MINPQAALLNQTLRDQTPTVHALLSARGRGVFYPKGGILKQASEAKGTTINATIGIAKEETGEAMHLASLMDQVNFSPDEVLPYLPSYGLQPLRQLWAEKIRAKNPELSAPISTPVVTSGLSHGLTNAAYLFLDPGDKLILADKFWGNYKLMFQNGFGVKFNTFNSFHNGGFDTESLRAKLAEGEIGKKVLLLNAPNNPTGYTPTVDEAAEIVEILHQAAVAGNKLLVILDDAYFGLVYEEGVLKHSLFTELSDLHENLLALKLDGATKEDYAWGIRVGFMTYGGKGLTPDSLAALEDKTAGVVRGTISITSHLSQRLVLHTYQSPTYTAEKQAKYNLLQKRYQTVQDILNKNSDQYNQYFTPLPFNSGYFMCVELAAGLEPDAVRRRLIEEFDTGVIATGPFLRLAYSSVPTEKLEALFTNLYHACQKLSPSETNTK